LCAGCKQAVFLCCVLSVQGMTGRCCSSESNQLGYLWSGNPEGGVSSFSHLACSLFAEGSHGNFLVSVFTRVMFRGVWELQP
ncbi:hypothetical protein ATANTOWER_025021, partial [Ataeniobius toweri]|nr:hypothetical protein [Ataeniobius toweri]